MPRAATPITDDELPALFAGLETTPLALAVSGGADSMALMHMIARWARREDVQAAWSEHWHGEFDRLSIASPQQFAQHAATRPRWLDGIASLDELRQAGGPPHVVVLTVDHGLRSEAAEEAAFVAREASQLGLPCQVLRWEGEKPATGIQVAAREARRALLVEAVHDEADCLATFLQSHGVRLRSQRRVLVMAHHQEDQAETLLMRLGRGSGLDGLRGMRELDYIRCPANERRPETIEAMVLRPLLDVPKARLVATLRAYGVRWIDDPSNEDERFERVRVRKALVQLEPLGFTAKMIALSARRLREAEFDLQMVLLGELSDQHPVVWHHGLMAEFEPKGPFFCGAYVWARTLRQVLGSLGGAARRPEMSEIERLIEIYCRGEVSGATLGGCRIEFVGAQGRKLRVYREGRGESLSVMPIAPGARIEWDGGRFTIEAGPAAPAGATVRALGMQGWADLKREVKGIGDLGWPAAAVATLPVIAHEDRVIAYPAIERLIADLPDLHPSLRERWSDCVQYRDGAKYSSTFNFEWW